MTHAADDTAIISFDRVAKSFPGHRAIENLDFSISRGELVSVVGVTGCGKSTMFNLVLGLISPTEGTVRVDGHDPNLEFEWFRRRMAVVFQDSRLLPWRTAIQNVCAGMRFAGIPKDRCEKTALDWLERLGLKGREHSYPHQLSGGQRQRVSMARAFAVDPELILCDESFSALDEITATALRAEFVELVRAGGKTGIVITHNIGEALALGNRVLVLRPPGRLADDVALPDERPDEVQATPRARILQAMDPDAPAAGTDDTPAEVVSAS